MLEHKLFTQDLIPILRAKRLKAGLQKDLEWCHQGKEHKDRNRVLFVNHNGIDDLCKVLHLSGQLLLQHKTSSYHQFQTRFVSMI